MNSERLLMVLREPHTSEKSTVMADKFKQFTFRVLQTATKKEIKEAVEHLFNVKVKNVTVVNVKGKTKRFRQLSGKRNDWKKAFVTLHADQDIDFTVSE
ncbi:50S ribosomal protein L23 [Legionella israelensis]|uniref:Large ribosomal subunit protein uL23 n=1 Tax=Legionella israelensis TaxID=454 RepID=A0A0W0VIP3_9GAMM|nr:50S ribosomal protein L23 [Legionella israelensis]KTD19985.1 50S ribosomal protein L23 [Legionella israelensis]QBS09913.1 50S ribosomal protein L23 [Legionella israelensis]SCY40278.1 large subunit ribosomal protein L23 [Legionella israelensis DSM 19235]STX59476.1 50S ribosomal protein L23 [Legionella israelensis]